MKSIEALISFRSFKLRLSDPLKCALDSDKSQPTGFNLSHSYRYQIDDYLNLVSFSRCIFKLNP